MKSKRIEMASTKSKMMTSESEIVNKNETGTIEREYGMGSNTRESRNTKRRKAEKSVRREQDRMHQAKYEWEGIGKEASGKKQEQVRGPG